jgi:hypothetical protein
MSYFFMNLFQVYLSSNQFYIKHKLNDLFGHIYYNYSINYYIKCMFYHSTDNIFKDKQYNSFFNCIELMVSIFYFLKDCTLKSTFHID